MSAPSSPAGDGGDDDFGHKTNQALHLEDVESTGPGRIDTSGILGGGVLVAILASDALVTAGAKLPSAIFGARPITGENDRTQSGNHSSVVEHSIQLIHGVGAKSVPDLGAIEGNPGHRVGFVLVVGDIGEVLKAWNLVPQGLIKEG